MSDFPINPPQPNPQPNDPQSNDPRIFTQSIAHQPVGARVPERVARGVVSTGQVVLDSPKEFVIDFLQGLTRPAQVVARVVMTPATMGEFARALSDNVDKYGK